MKFAILGSGSKGNSSVICSAEASILVDCGFAAKELEQRLFQLGLHPSSLNAILLTHEHTDHSKGVGSLARKYGLSVYMTAGTLLSRDFGYLENLNVVHGYQPFKVGDISVTPVAVPHDAREPAQFIFKHGDTRVGVLTDLGCITPHVLSCYEQCDALVLEANHDLKMLAEGAYPARLKARVGSNWGHLNNEQALRLFEYLAERLRVLIVAHISENNNCPRLVASLFQNDVYDTVIHVAEQNRVSDWYALE